MDCAGLPEVTLGEVGEELLRQLGGRRYPLSASLELTERCNLNCLMCYVNQPAGSREMAAREMTLAQIQGVLDDFAGAGGLFLLVTGGEPLLRPDFCDIWRHARRRGLLVSLFTNGTLLTPRIADCLAEWRPTSLEITLYGATQETYERVTRVPGSYLRCLRGIELALERGLRLELKSTIVKANRHEIEAMEALAEGFGTRHRFDAMLFPRLDGTGGMPHQRLSPAEVVALDRLYPERLQEFERFYGEFAGAVVRNEYVYSCLAGKRSFHVDSAGRMSLCMLARKPAYDLLRGTFQEGWEFLGTLLEQKRTMDTPCRTCTVGVQCIQCPGWSQLVHGDNETPVDYVCEIGRLRAAWGLASVGGSTKATPARRPTPSRGERDESKRSEWPRVPVQAGLPD